MQKFKKNDKIKCVKKPSGPDTKFEVGKTYTVMAYMDEDLQVNPDESTGLLMVKEIKGIAKQDNFELAE